MLPELNSTTTVAQNGRKAYNDGTGQKLHVRRVYKSSKKSSAASKQSMNTWAHVASQQKAKPTPPLRLSLAAVPLVESSQTARDKSPKKASSIRQPKTAREYVNIRPKPHQNSNAYNINQQATQAVGPFTPTQVLQFYSHELTDFEKREILDFKEIYYIGSLSKKQRKGTNENNGHDDERGDYQVVLHDHLLYRYEVLSTLGRGSFGQVLKCLDHKTKTVSAIKIIRNKKRFHQQAVIELKILNHIKRTDPNEQSNCIHIRDHFSFRNHLCLGFDLMQMNLYEYIKANNFEGLHLNFIRKIAIQIMQSLQYTKHHSIIHCDLKPENILLKQAHMPGIKVIDFGSSCFQSERLYTYIQSRFYRSPEVILGLPYGIEIDMWSFGCILVELYTGYPIFPGENEIEQLACIMEVLGVPPKHLLDQSTRRKMFFDSNMNPRIVPNSRGKKRRPNGKNLETILNGADPIFIDFTRQCLQWDSGVRMSPEAGLRHSWVQDDTVESSAVSTSVVNSSNHYHTSKLYPQAEPALVVPPPPVSNTFQRLQGHNHAHKHIAAQVKSGTGTGRTGQKRAYSPKGQDDGNTKIKFPALPPIGIDNCGPFNTAAGTSNITQTKVYPTPYARNRK